MKKPPYKHVSLKALEINNKEMTYAMSGNERALPKYKVWTDQEYLHL